MTNELQYTLEWILKPGGLDTVQDLGAKVFEYFDVLRDKLNK